MDLDFAVTLPMRAADTNTRPSHRLPAGSCDTHFHVFEEGYPHVADPQYTFPEATLDQYVALADFLGIERMVLVQPTYYGEDNSLAIEVLRRLGPRARAVVRIEEDAGDALLDRYHELGVRAIRLDLFARRSWPLPDLERYVAAMAARAAVRGWHIQFYAPGAVVKALLPFLARQKGRFVVDHMGYMKKSDGLGDADFRALLAALDVGNLWIKLTGPYRLAGAEPMRSVEPIGRALVESGPHRMLWGSDWPHLPNGQRDTGELLDLLQDWAPREEDRKQILVDAPTELFFS